MGDREVTDTHCFLCGMRTRKKIPWFTNNGKHYYTVVVCARHGAIKGKIRLRRAEDGGIYVVKTMKQIDSDGVQDIMDKKSQVRQSRKERRHKKEDLV